MRLVAALIVILCGSPLAAGEVATTAGKLRIDRMLGGLTEPWGLAFLPGGGILVTERGGRLVHVMADGTRAAVNGVPRTRQGGQAGLLDVVAARDFATSRTLYLTYARSQGAGASTAVLRAQLSADGRSLEGATTIFTASPVSTGGLHFGSRIVEGRDGLLYVTIGDRGVADDAQDRTKHSGKVIRIHPDGSLPAGNPFADGSGGQAVYSYGHRNPQGAAMDESGAIWVVEHGPKGGDEVNRVAHGANFGWPVIGYGTHYSGAKVGVGTAAPGMTQPAHYWDPSIAPSGMMIYSGKLWPQWRGDFFIGSLKFDLISRLERSGNRLAEAERISAPETGRVRDIREAPDGSIWFLSVDDGAVYRIAPAG